MWEAIVELDSGILDQFRSVAAAQAHEALSQDAALEEGVELLFDELRKVCAGCVFNLSEERRGVLLHSVSVTPRSRQGTLEKG